MAAGVHREHCIEAAASGIDRHDRLRHGRQRHGVPVPDRGADAAARLRLAAIEREAGAAPRVVVRQHGDLDRRRGVIRIHGADREVLAGGV